MDQDLKEGAEHDESITFNSVEGAVINADIFVSYTFEADKVPAMYVEFRQDADTITNVFIRSEVRDAISRRASTMKVTDIFGMRKSELENGALADLKARLGAKGFTFESVSFVGGLRVDGDVAGAIHAVIMATQKAIEAQNKIVQAEAEAAQKVKTAYGDSLSIVMVAQANAQANTMLNKSLTPLVLQWQKQERWDGRNPLVVGSSGTLLNLPAVTTTSTDYSAPRFEKTSLADGGMATR